MAATETPTAPPAIDSHAQIDALEGRALDTAVAAHIMDWREVWTDTTTTPGKVFWLGLPPGGPSPPCHIPCYSNGADMNATWRVVAEMHKRLFSTRMRFKAHLREQINARLLTPDSRGTNIASEEWLLIVISQDICRAALHAILETKECQSKELPSREPQ